MRRPHKSYTICSPETSSTLSVSNILAAQILPKFRINQRPRADIISNRNHDIADAKYNVTLAPLMCWEKMRTQIHIRKCNDSTKTTKTIDIQCHVQIEYTQKNESLLIMTCLFLSFCDKANQSHHLQLSSVHPLIIRFLFSMSIKSSIPEPGYQTASSSRDNRLYLCIGG